MYQPFQKIKKFTAAEIANEINNNLNVKKAPGVDNIPFGLLKELSAKVVHILTIFFNAYLRLEYVPDILKIAQTIMIKKTQ